MGRMSFAQIVVEADQMTRTHAQREAAITRAHFERHPECRRIILRMDEEGHVIRGRGEIDVDARCRPGWFSTRMWRQDGDDQRPVEAERSSAKPGMPYRVVVEMTTQEQHLPDRDYGLVDLPQWLKQHYVPVLKNLYPSAPVPAARASRPLAETIQETQGLVRVLQSMLTGVI